MLQEEEVIGDVFRRQEQGGGLGKIWNRRKIREEVLRSTPTYIRCELTFNLDDSGMKEWVTPKVRQWALTLNKAELFILASTYLLAHIKLLCVLQ
jgi:hypothetical protein